MAGWDVLMQPYIYHPPVEPVMPKPQITTGEAVQNLLRGAIARRDQQLEQQRMVQNADLTMRGQDVTAADAQLRYQVAKENADSQEKARVDEAAWHTKTADDRMKLMESTKTAKQAKDEALQNHVASINDLDTKAYLDAKGSGLLDEVGSALDPGEYFMRAQRYIQKFGLAKAGAAPAIVDSIKKKIDSMAVPYVAGAQLVAKDGTHDATNKNGGLDWRIPVTKDGVTTWDYANSHAKTATLSDIAREYATDPRGVERGLIAAGHGTVENKNGIATPKLDEFASNLVKAFKTPRTTIGNEVPRGLMSTEPEWRVKAGVGQDSGGGQDTPNQGPPIGTAGDIDGQPVIWNGKSWVAQ